MTKFKNKTVVITGGTSGIGLATAKQFIDHGADVIFTSRSRENVKKTESKLGPQAKGIVSDAGNTKHLWNLKSEVSKHTDNVDVLFVNAGFGKFNSLTETTEDEFDSQFNTLVKGGYFTVQQLVSMIPDGGTVIFNTSVVTDMAMPGASVYGAAKSAVKYLNKSFANELKDRNIRVNAVSPGPIGTNFFNEAGVPQEQQEQMASQILSQVPMNRFGEAKEIADTVLFLASDESSFITGHEIQIDGGMVQV